MKNSKLSIWFVLAVLITFTLLPSLFGLEAYFQLNGISWIVLIILVGTIWYFRWKQRSDSNTHISYKPWGREFFVLRFLMSNKHSSMRKVMLVVISITILVVSLTLSTILLGFLSQKKNEDTKNQAIMKAKEIYLQKKIEWNNDFGEGYCLTNELQPDWVADIVHNPRQTVDNLPKNQCIYLLSSKAHHLVEMDAVGNIIKVQ